MGCIYNGKDLHWLLFSCGNRSQILLLWWHTVVFHLIDMGVYQNWIGFQIVCVSLICSYIWQEVRRCSSVSTSFCGQWANSLSSLESQVCLRQPHSIARLCSLSLHIVKAFLKFRSVKSGQIFCHWLLSVKGQIVFQFALFFGYFFPMCQVIFFSVFSWFGWV